MKITIFRLLFSLLILFILGAQKAYAYIDPGSGSYLFQLILGLFVGLSFTMKIYWRNIKTGLLKLLIKRKKT